MADCGCDLRKSCEAVLIWKLPRSFASVLFANHVAFGENLAQAIENCHRIYPSR
jgi:hypothetical protein